MLARDDAAARLGLAPGLPVSKAQAMVKGLIVIEGDPAADAQALDRLAIWAQRRYAPLVAPDPPDGLMIEVAGSAHLFGGEEALMCDLAERLAAAGFAARIAIAPSYGAAHALARFGPPPAVAIGPKGLAPALSPLPVASLRLPVDMVAALSRLGFDTVGELAAAPRGSLAHRFGDLVLTRLDQAFARVAEPFEPVEAPERLAVRRNFAEPIGAPETLARYTGKLVEALCAELDARSLGARRLDLFFHRVDNRIEAVRIGTAKPVREVKRLTRLLVERIERVDPGFGIEKMVLAASVAEPLGYRALTSLLDVQAPDVSDLIDTLANRIGRAGQVYRPAATVSELPERAVARIAPLAPATAKSWPTEWPRPSRLLDPPERIETMALLPDHPPAFFTWRGVRRRVARADGPERLFGEWWRSDAEMEAVRDYFCVEDDGGERFWLYRAGDGEDPASGAQDWFIHGIFG